MGLISSSSARSTSTSQKLLGPALLSTPIFAALIAFVYALGADGTTKFLAVLAILWMSAAAAFALGVLLGFVFALPRTLEQTDRVGLLATNSNLDQVSDWVTKILVGLTLVQAGRIAGGIDDIGNSLAGALGDAPGAHSFSIALLIFALIGGFILGYLWTRTSISSAFRRAAEDLATGSDLAEVLHCVPPPEKPPEAAPPPPQETPTPASPEQAAAALPSPPDAAAAGA